MFDYGTSSDYVNLALMSAKVIESLITESRDIDRQGAAIQHDDHSSAPESEIDSFVSAYHDWYARALDVLPAELEERFREKFTSAGFFSTSRISDFLKAPIEKSPFYNADEPSELIPYWNHPYERDFKGHFLDQVQILTEALQRLRGTGRTSESLELIERICRNLPEFLEPFRHRHAGRPPFEIEDEYDLQTVIHAQLNALFDDVRPEDFASERSGARSRIDFVLKAEKIVIETKMTRKGLDNKKVGEELIVDIDRYRAHPDCGALVALIFDPGRRLQNRRALENDLSGSKDGLVVRVFVVQ